ncbi:MAG: hypothetical protein HYZ26_11810 [Chloroflexi bacterium]|nr:hypothetical protein [Chloroflexota bacterium]
MAAPISPHDLETLSAFLDNQLPGRERNRIQERLLAEPALKAALEDLRRTRAVLRRAPRLRAPRTFRLTAAMLQPGAAPNPWFATLRMASILATVALAVLVTGEVAAFRLRSIGLTFGAASPAYEEPAAAAQAPEAESLGATDTTTPLETGPAEGEMTLMAVTETPPALEAAAPAEGGAAADAAEPEEDPVFRTAEKAATPSALRLAQFGLAGLALVSGLAAWLLRRRRP